MARVKKGSVRKGRGAMCNVCGLNCGKGGALSSHVKSAHGIEYEAYKRCFYGEVKTLVAEKWDDSVATTKGRRVIIHVLVRRFVRDAEPRGAAKHTKSAAAK